MTADWGAYLNAAEDNSDGSIVVVTSGAEDGEVVTITGMGFTDTCSLSSNTCDATIAAADLQGLSDGTTYTLTVNVDDTAGNAATADTGDTFVYDITAPTSSSASEATSGSGNANHNDVVTITLDPSETVGTPTCTFTDGSGAMADTSVTYGTTGSDSHTAAVTVACLLYTSPSPRDRTRSRMPSSA